MRKMKHAQILKRLQKVQSESVVEQELKPEWLGSRGHT